MNTDQTHVRWWPRPTILLSCLLLILLPFDLGVIQDYLKTFLLALVTVILTGVAFNGLCHRPHLFWHSCDGLIASIPLLYWVYVACGYTGYDPFFLASFWTIVVIFFFVSRYLLTTELMECIRDGLAVSTIVIGCAGLLMIFGWGHVDWMSSSKRLCLTLSHPNILAAWLVCIMPYLLAPLLVVEGGGKWRIIHWLAVGTAITLIIFSQSRMGFLLMGLIFFWVGIATVRSGRVRLSWKLIGIISGALVAVGVLAVSLGLIDRLSMLIVSGENSRVFLYRAAWDMLNVDMPTRVFGIGVGCFAESIYSVPVDQYDFIGRVRGDFYSHNLMLDLWLDIGLIGIGCFLGFLLSTFWMGWTMLKREKKFSSKRPWIIASLMVVVVFGLFSMVSVSCRTAVPQIPFWLGCSFIWSCAAGSLKNRRFLSAWFPLVVLAVLGIGALILVSRCFIGDRLLRLAIEETVKKEPVDGRVKQLLLTSSKWHPGNIQLWASSLEWAVRHDDHELAEQAYEHADRLIPMFDRTPLTFAHHQLTRGRPEVSLDVLDAYIRANPFALEGHFESVVTALNLNDRKILIAALERMIRASILFVNLRENREIEIRESGAAEPASSALIFILEDGTEHELPKAKLPAFFLGTSFQTNREVWEELEARFDFFFRNYISSRTHMNMLFLRANADSRRSFGAVSDS